MLVGRSEVKTGEESGVRREGEGRLEIRIVEEDFYEDRKPLVFVVESSRLFFRYDGRQKS